MEPIHQSEHGAIESREGQGSARCAKLRRIFSQGEIAAMRGAMFAGPMRSLQLQQSARGGLLGGPAADGIPDQLPPVQRMGHAPTDHKDLGGAVPLPFEQWMGKVVVQMHRASSRTWHKGQVLAGEIRWKSMQAEGE